MEYFETVKENIFPIISILIGVTGLTFAFFTAKRNRKEKKPTYLIKTRSVIRRLSFNKLKITYEGEKVETLDMSKLLFMNEGNIHIDRNDIDPNHPLRITFPEDTLIYDFDIIHVNRKKMDVNIEKGDQELKLDFDYLNKGDGFIVQVLHSKLSQNIPIEGNIKGVNKIGKTKEVRAELPEKKALVRVTLIFIALFAISFISLHSGSETFRDISFTTTLIVSLSFLLQYFELAKYYYVVAVNGKKKFELIQKLNS